MGQDGDTLPASPHWSRRLQISPTLHPKHLSAPASGVKDDHQPLHHGGTTPPPSRGGLNIHKGSHGQDQRGTLWRAAELLPISVSTP